MKRRKFLAAAATAPLAGIIAALPIAGIASAQDDGGFQDLLDILEKLPPDRREFVFSYTRFLAEDARKQRAAS